MITLTTEQAQQIEEALDTAYGLAESGRAEHKYATALATIRAARAQGQAEQEPVAIADGTFNHNCPIGTPLYAAPIEPVKQEPVAYEVGGWYKQQNGEWVQFVEVANAGKSYETMCCKDGIHRYTKRDFGRVTGSPHDYSDPRDMPPLYTRPVRTKDLTDDECVDVYTAAYNRKESALGICRAVIAADRELNK